MRSCAVSSKSWCYMHKPLTQQAGLCGTCFPLFYIYQPPVQVYAIDHGEDPNEYDVTHELIAPFDHQMRKKVSRTEKEGVWTGFISNVLFRNSQVQMLTKRKIRIYLYYIRTEEEQLHPSLDGIRHSSGGNPRCRGEVTKSYKTILISNILDCNELSQLYPYPNHTITFQTTSLIKCALAPATTSFFSTTSRPNCCDD
jgi:hypothetical protein